MRALVWHGKGDVRCDTVPDPIIEDPRDIIVKITSTAICGSDLHLTIITCQRWKKATSSATNRWAK
jgi:threonine dehydrogenase-like Zn-dependent dehydrogenase